LEYREGFSISWKKKAAIPMGGLNDYGIPKAWGRGVERFGILRGRGVEHFGIS